MIPAQIVARPHADERWTPEVVALVPLGYWLREMVAIYGGTPRVGVGGRGRGAAPGRLRGQPDSAID